MLTTEHRIQVQSAISTAAFAETASLAATTDRYEKARDALERARTSLERGELPPEDAKLDKRDWPGHVRYLLEINRIDASFTQIEYRSELWKSRDRVVEVARNAIRDYTPR
jgi:hypothetical protein